MGKGSLGLCLAAWAAGAFAVACAEGTAPNEDLVTPQVDAAAPTKDSGVTKDSGHPANDATANDTGAADTATADEPDAAAPTPLVYGHSSDTLYAYDPTTRVTTKIAPFSGCTTNVLTQVIDIAIDSSSHAYATTFDGFYSLDLSTAGCTIIKAGAYPNSLSFVPKGTLDPNAEALVGYSGSTYLRIDTQTGTITTVGSLTGYVSSGDIVSVTGGGSFLTVTGSGCTTGDCLLQIDPTTGDMLQNYGALTHSAVYGLGYWAGALYGFDEGGDLFQILGSNGDGGLLSSDLTQDGGVPWWGAGSTTAAPVKDADGGSISIK